MVAPVGAPVPTSFHSNCVGKSFSLSPSGLQAARVSHNDPGSQTRTLGGPRPWTAATILREDPPERKKKEASKVYLPLPPRRLNFFLKKRNVTRNREAIEANKNQFFSTREKIREKEKDEDKKKKKTKP